MLEFIEFRAFTDRLFALAKESGDDVLLEMQNDLMSDPERGVVVQGTAGVRKARAANPARGKGKRGGFRYLYYYIERDEQIFLLLLFGKNEQDNMSPTQKKALAKTARELKGIK